MVNVFGEPGRLPGLWQELLANGQVFTALVLSTVFSEKYKGRNMKPGASAQVKLPALDGQGLVWMPTLVGKAGHVEAGAIIWRGDDAAGDGILYVAFSPLRRIKQFMKLYCMGSQIEADVKTTQLARDRGLFSHEGDSLVCGTYVNRHLDRMWYKEGFGDVLAAAVARHSDCPVLFTGLSHGGTLAQAAAARFSVMNPQSIVQCLTWNAYKWTDAVGVALFKKLLGENVLSFVLSRTDRSGCRFWDSVAEYPAELEPVNGSALLDADSGEVILAPPFSRAVVNLRFCTRLKELHFAKTALTATRFATLTCCPGYESFQASARRTLLQDSTPNCCGCCPAVDTGVLANGGQNGARTQSSWRWRNCIWRRREEEPQEGS